MTPFRFIKLHERTGNTEILVNVEQIVFIRDNRTDPAVKKIKDFQWTTIGATRYVFEVIESEEEILNKIALLR